VHFHDESGETIERSIVIDGRASIRKSAVTEKIHPCHGDFQS
jgi:hypothetical protein